MNIDQLKLALKVSHESGVPLFIWGGQGIGKSVGVKQYTDSCFHFTKGKGEETTEVLPYRLIDLRCAQMEASEIRGLPEKDEVNKSVVYFTPSELPRGEWINRDGKTYGEVGSDNPGIVDPDKFGSPDNWTLHKGVLFLDEVNRAQDDVLQAIFQLVYDRKVGEYMMPTGWSVIVAGNPSGSKFTVNSFIDDAAFKDRFCHVFIDFDDSYYQSWVDYMTSMRNVNPAIMARITQFCLTNPENMNRTDDEDRDNFSITPSSRSWEFVAKVEQAIEDLFNNVSIDDEIIKKVRGQMIRGLVGDVANAYISSSIDIMPLDIIRMGFNNSHKKIIKQKMEKGQLQALMWGVANHAKKLDTKDDLDKMRNTIDFGKWVLEEGEDNRDLAVAYFDILLEAEQKSSIRRLSFSNPSLKKLMKKTGQNSPWYDLINEDNKLSKLLHDSHRGELNE